MYTSRPSSVKHKSYRHAKIIADERSFNQCCCIINSIHAKTNPISRSVLMCMVNLMSTNKDFHLENVEATHGRAIENANRCEEFLLTIGGASMMRFEGGQFSTPETRLAMAHFLYAMTVNNECRHLIAEDRCLDPRSLTKNST